ANDWKQDDVRRRRIAELPSLPVGLFDFRSRVAARGREGDAELGQELELQRSPHAQIADFVDQREPRPAMSRRFEIGGTAGGVARCGREGTDRFVEATRTGKMVREPVRPG